uniref:Small ribosomal subunit protein bS18c n=1 Tax=Oogamochlamys gigantea TaxID=158507 RepID=A0A0S2LN23_9CHLO|nr:ribosomal protein S18 [Oogamochlamys gigantea]ALO62815.1 ribosomal protein S18 [Oogamochlamys gigantea]
MQNLTRKILNGNLEKGLLTINVFKISEQASQGQKKRSWGGQRLSQKGTPANNRIGRQFANTQGSIKNGSQTRLKGKQKMLNQKQIKSGIKVLSLSQLLAGFRQERQEKIDQQKRPAPIKPIILPKSFVIILTEKPKKIVFNRRIIDYKHCGLLQRYLGLGGKILPRRQTRLTAKQQRFVAKAIKSARVMGLLPFVSKERGFFR